MAKDDRIIVEIELDDGTIKKGFLKIEKQAKKTSKKVEKNMSGKGLNKFGAALGGLKRKLLGIGAAFITAFAGRAVIAASAKQEEAVNKLNTALKLSGRFSEGASIRLQEFASEMQNASRFGDELLLEVMGLIQGLGQLEEKGLKRATQATADLASALRIDLRAAALLVGKAAAGEVSSFSRYGLIIEKGATQAKTFANALSAIEGKFGGAASKAVETFAGRTDQLSNAFGDLLEGLGDFITQSPQVVSFIKDLSDSIAILATNLKDRAASKYGEGLKKLNADFRLATGRVIDAKEAFKEFKKTLSGKLFVSVFGEKESKELAVAREELKKATVALKEFKEAAKGEGGEPPSLLPPTGAEVAKAKKLNQLIAQTQLSAVETQLQTNAMLRASGESAFDQQFLIKEKEILLTQMTELKKQEILASFADNRAVTTEQRQALEVALEEAKNEKIRQLQEQQLAESLKGYRKANKQIANVLKNGVIKTVSNAMQMLGASLTQGGGAFSNFKGMVLGILGDMAIQIGSTLIAIGLGIEAIKASIIGMTAGPALAAGLALIALGGLLKSLSGGGAGGGGVSAAPGIADGSAVTGDISSPVTEIGEPATPDTRVAVHIQGDVLDSRETGMRIIELINDQFDREGTVIAGATA